MSDNNKVDKYIDDFIADLLSGNIEFSYSKSKDLFTFTTEKNILGSEKKKQNNLLVSDLGLVLTDYLQSRNNPELHQRLANNCIKFIIWVNTAQIIKRTGMTKRIDELTKENTHLKEEKDKYRREVERLTLLNNALHEALDKLGIQRIGKKDKGKVGGQEE